MATMTDKKANKLNSIFSQHKDEILSEWLREMDGAARRSDLIKASELQEQCSRFIALLTGALATGEPVQSSAYDPLREMLGEISGSRALQGFTARETAIFVLSL